MKKNFYISALTSIGIGLYSQFSFANLQTQCLSSVPQFTGESNEGNLNELPIYIYANQAEAGSSYAKYSGNVEVQQGSRYLSAEQLEVVEQDSTQRVAFAPQGFRYSDHQIELKGKSAEVNLNNRNSSVSGASYHLVGRQGRGEAVSINSNSTERVMHNATFTSCLQNDDSWSIQASEIRQDIEGEYAEMWNARFKIYGVPVFYTPYLQLPIGDRRRSGLLIPKVGRSSRHGYYYAQPIYWNIAPNADFTFTPKFMSKRGWQFNGEARYLTKLGEGVIVSEYMHHDRLKNHLDDDFSRYLFYWKHNTSLSENWRLELDYTKVSDTAYFDDFQSEYGNSTDGYAVQYGKVAYHQPNYNIALSVKQFQVFGDVNEAPYRVIPQLDINYYKNNIANLVDFKVFAQATRFENKNPMMPRASRFHIEPALSLPLSNRYGSLNLETKLYATKYYQQSGNDPRAEQVKRSVSRVLPQVKVELQTSLTSPNTFISGYTQTLEPRIQYLYRPYKNQSAIGSSAATDYFGYDSSLLQQDYLALFSDRRYAGLDRIASANQATVGVTTRFYDGKGEERFNLSAGQIYYMKDARIDDSADNSSQGNSSSWSLESNWKLNDNIYWRGSLQYDTRLNEMSLANFALEYQVNNHNLVQLSYRYVNQNYIAQNLSRKTNGEAQDIKQLGIVTAWELNDYWSVVARHYQDLSLDKPLEQYLGLEYHTCCWAVNFGARRGVASRPNQRNNEIFYDRSFTINFELRGLSPSMHYNNIEKMLSSGKLPYLKTLAF
ncbi:LPS assembly protein LptD [[Haemophilus] felis]|nr:LPS assembly protein LptD [[Haemophilus] felis]